MRGRAASADAGLTRVRHGGLDAPHRADGLRSQASAPWRAFVEHAPAAIAVFDREMVYIAASARWRQDYGLSGDPAGRSHYDVFPDLPESWKAVHRRCLNGASEMSDGERFQRADGSAHWLRWEINPWRDDEGEIGGLVIVTEAARALRGEQPAACDALFGIREGGAIRAQVEARPLRNDAGAICIVRDIADEALRASRQRLELAAAAAEFGVWEWDLRAGTAIWDATMFRLYGVTPTEGGVTTRSQWRRAPLPEELAEQTETLDRIVREGGVANQEFRIRRQNDGAIRYLQMSATSRRNAAGEVQWLVGVMIDVTERREAEAELKRLNATLEERVREAVGAREAAYANLAQAEKLGALGQLAGGVAHDFNNIAQAITGAAALIGRNAGEPEKVRRYAEMMAQTAARAASITKRLLSLARRSDLKAEAFDVVGVLAGLREVLVHTLGPRIAVHLRAPKDLPLVLADRGQLETVVVNLASNARDAIEGDGAIVLSAASEDLPQGRAEIGLSPGRYVRIAVADTGVGMDAATLNRAMEPFFTTKGVGKGAGLGLPMARGFAQQSGGGLTIESEPGRGATVKLWLPVGEPAGPAPPSAAAMRPKALRILLVDDEEAVREVLRGELADAGFDVVDAHGARPALAAMETARFDLLITDLSMPGLDGLGLIRAAQSRRPGLPAILLTGYAGQAAADALRDFDERAVLLLGKPITGPDLVDQIARFMQGRAARAEG